MKMLFYVGVLGLFIALYNYSWEVLLLIVLFLSGAIVRRLFYPSAEERAWKPEQYITSRFETAQLRRSAVRTALPKPWNQVVASVTQDIAVAFGIGAFFGTAIAYGLLISRIAFEPTQTSFDGLGTFAKIDDLLSTDLGPFLVIMAFVCPIVWLGMHMFFWGRSIGEATARDVASTFYWNWMNGEYSDELRAKKLAEQDKTL